MSDTPMTDAAREWYASGDNYQYALPVADTDMAKLERELARCRHVLGVAIAARCAFHNKLAAMTAAKNKAVEALIKVVSICAWCGGSGREREDVEAAPCPLCSENRKLVAELEAV